MRVDREQAQSWDASAVIERWHRLFRGNGLSQRFSNGETLSTVELQVLEDCVETWRERLMSISWFMKQLNEFIAREANKEDRCKGRFWDRFLLLAKPAYITSCK